LYIILYHNIIYLRLFLRLEKTGTLSRLLLKYNLASPSKVDDFIKHSFKYEVDKNTTTPSVVLFDCTHRPDAVLSLKDMQIAIEIKKGCSGGNLRAGVGQSVLYSVEFDFTIYLFVDQTNNLAIKESATGNRERALVQDLWDSRNIKFEIV